MKWLNPFYTLWVVGEILVVAIYSCYVCAEDFKVMKRNKKQNNELHALLSKAKIDNETKMNMVLTYTNNRTMKSSGMTMEECQTMINHLSQMLKYNERCDKMRKKIISLFRRQGYVLENGKADMKAIEGWCEKYGYLHKRLNAYTEDELPQLVTQANKAYLSYVVWMDREIGDKKQENR